MTTNENNSPTLRDRQETADRLKICVATLDALVRKGIGPMPTRIGKRVFFLDAEIESYLRRQTAQKRARLSVLDCSLAPIVRAELEARAANLPAELHEVAAAAATLVRSWDIRANANQINEPDAKALASMTENLIRCLILLGGTETMEGTLAEEIAIGALHTVKRSFPHVLAEEFR